MPPRWYYDDMDGQRHYQLDAYGNQLGTRHPPPARMADSHGTRYEVGDYVEAQNGWAGRVVAIKPHGVCVASDERESEGFNRSKPINLRFWRVVRRGAHAETPVPPLAPKRGPLAKLDADVAAVCALVAA